MINKYNVGLSSFEIFKGDKPKINLIKIDESSPNEYYFKCVLFLSPAFIDQIKLLNRLYFYLTIFESTDFIEYRPINYQEIELTAEKVPHNNLVKLNYSLAIPIHYKEVDNKKYLKTPLKALGLTLSCTAINFADPHFLQENDEGTILNTFFPVEVTGYGQ